MTEEELIEFIEEHEPVSIGDIENKTDLHDREIVNTLYELFELGEIYQPQPREIKVVPE